MERKINLLNFDDRITPILSRECIASIKEILRHQINFDYPSKFDVSLRYRHPYTDQHRVPKRDVVHVHIPYIILII